MRTLMKAGLRTAALFLGYTAVAPASDFCLDNGVTLKAFSIPGTGICKEHRGFTPGGEHFLSGAACGSSNGLTITFTHLMVSNDDVRTQEITLNRQGLTGTFRECIIEAVSGVGCAAPLAVAKTLCSPATVPVP